MGCKSMLIKCPECGKEISDKSTQCIHCGFPLNKTDNRNICVINNKEIDLSDLLPLILKDDDMVQTLMKIRQKCDLQLKDAKNLYNIILHDKEVPKEYNCMVDFSLQTSNEPKCPTCNSTNIKKISGLSKASSVAMFGIFSQKVKKQMHCNNCGYEW